MVKFNKLFFLLFLTFFVFNFKLFSQNFDNSNTEVSRSENTVNEFDESSIKFTDSAISNPIDNTNQISYKSPSVGRLLLRMVITLLIVVAFIYLFFKYMKVKNKSYKPSDEYLRRAAYLSIAPNKTIEVITLLDKGYLIGVTDDKISLLSEINDKELINAMNVHADANSNTKKAASFEELLDLILVRGKKKSAFSDAESQVDSIISNNEKL